MRLDSEIFDQIVGDKVIYYTSDGGDRRMPRAQTCLEAKLESRNGERSVEILDLSRTGARLQCSTAALAGQRVTLRIEISGGERLSLLCIVRHCMPEEDVFQIGVEYLELIEPEPVACPETR